MYTSFMLVTNMANDSTYMYNFHKITLVEFFNLEKFIKIILSKNKKLINTFLMR